jgi:hypothetical protein
MRYATQRFSVEHIVPRARDGATVRENLTLACQGCNNHKYQKIVALDPVTTQLAPLYHPRRDRWATHFAWNDDFTLIIGLTPTGRATVAALYLNREGVVNLRSLLVASGEHPPLVIQPEPPAS